MKKKLSVLRCRFLPWHIVRLIFQDGEKTEKFCSCGRIY